MKEAYGMLYDIENSLRQYINDQMSRLYGPAWRIKAPKRHKFLKRPLEHTPIYIFENYLRLYLNTPTSIIDSLRKVYPIRNAIAHCREITVDEYLTLTECKEKIFSYCNITDSDKNLLEV